MKKLILGFLVLSMLLPCFGEIHSKRGSKDDLSMEIFWDDTVSETIKSILSEKEIIEVLDNILFEIPEYYRNTVGKFFIVQSDVYIIVMTESSFDLDVCVGFYNAEDNYIEMLYADTFKSFNEARKEFDRLCAEYYKKLKK